MTGTALILLLTVLFCVRLRRLPPAARVAAAYLLGIGVPVFALCALARFGIPAGRPVIAIVFALAVGLLLALPRRGAPGTRDPEWIGMFAVTLGAAAITALVGRSPADELLIDPWTHIAWSRNLPAALDVYPPGFPAFFAVMGLDDRLIGPFRLAPVLLHGALVAQFLAVGERVRARTAAVVCALAYLTVPVAFGKFDPPRPELWAAVLIAASWWILLSETVSAKWKPLALGALTCMLLASHLSYLEIGHFAALGFAILWGGTKESAARRFPLLLSLVLGAALSLAVSPWPLIYISRLDSLPLTTSQEAARGLFDPLSIARMLGWTFSVAGAASLAWLALHGKGAHERLGGVFPGLLLFGALNVAPLLLVAAGVYIPIYFTPYRYILAAVVPLALLVAISSGLARERSLWGGHASLVLIALLTLHVVTRPAFSWTLGAAAGAVAIAAAWAARRRAAVVTRVAVCVLALGLAAGFRLWIWLPAPPPEAAWLAGSADPKLPVISNWPLTNALDAIVPQRVMDGLAGDDANVAHHRAWEVPQLRAGLAWCGEATAAAPDSLRASLARMKALPAYVVLGERFAESWRAYEAQREAIDRAGRRHRHSYYAAEPCPDSPPARLRAMRQSLEAHPGVRLEFSSERVAVYRMD